MKTDSTIKDITITDISISSFDLTALYISADRIHKYEKIITTFINHILNFSQLFHII